MIKSFRKEQYSAYLYDLKKKVDNYSSISKTSYIFADEIKKILGAELIAIVKYTYFKVEILSSVPIKNITDYSAHETYLILNTLINENKNIISNEDIHSEHFKEYFPLFPYETYKIIPVYTTDNEIITLEIYGEMNWFWNIKKERVFDIIEIFQNVLLQYQNLQKNVFINLKNEIIIDFLDKLKRTVNQNEFKKIILEETAHIFKADRCYFITINNNAPYEPVLGKEFLGSPYIMSLKGNNLDFRGVWKQLKDNQITPSVFAIENSDKFIRENNLENTSLALFIQKSHIKSSYPFLIKETNSSATYLVIQYTSKFVVFTKEDFETMELLLKQIKLAYSQIILYFELQKNNAKEQLLKEVYMESLKFKTTKQIYEYFTDKLLSLLSASGIVIIEFLSDENLNYFEKYKNSYYNLSKFKDIEILNELIKKKNFSYKCNFEEEDTNFHNFLIETSTKCIATIPFGDNFVLLVFFEEIKEFSDYDKSILFSLINIISNAIKELLQKAQINNLRENFLSVLAHDLQIPIIAERNAIKYLISQTQSSDDLKLKEILKNLEENNNEAEDMIKALTSVYKYEAGKKELDKGNYNIIDIIEECLKKFEYVIKNKTLTIIKNYQTENAYCYIDKNEIAKVIMIFLLLISDGVKNNSDIKIEITENAQYIKTCIIYEDDSLAGNITGMIFDRNITTNTLSKRVGERIYIYLARLIINAHQGKIYINNKVIRGNIFCFELKNNKITVL